MQDDVEKQINDIAMSIWLRGTDHLADTHDLEAQLLTIVTAAENRGLENAAKAVITATEIPKDAKEPTRDWLVVWGEKMAERIRSFKNTTAKEQQFNKKESDGEY